MDATEPCSDSDPIVDEVRRIRREICERAGHDLDRLFAELKQVEQDYIDRKGIYATATAEAAARVVESWGASSGPAVDPLLDPAAATRKADHSSSTK